MQEKCGSCFLVKPHIDGLAQDYINSIANALELLQSRAKPSIWSPRAICPLSPSSWYAHNANVFSSLIHKIVTDGIYCEHWESHVRLHNALLLYKYLMKYPAGNVDNNRRRSMWHCNVIKKLTIIHLNRDKIIPIVQTGLIDFYVSNVLYLTGIELDIFPRDPSNNMPALFQIMTWHQICAKPLFER